MHIFNSKSNLMATKLRRKMSDFNIKQTFADKHRFHDELFEMLRFLWTRAYKIESFNVY